MNHKQEADQNDDLNEKLIFQRDLALGLAASTSLDEALTLCIDAAIKLTGMDSVGIYLLDEELSRLWLACSRGISENFVKAVSSWERDSKRWSIIMAGKPVYKDYGELFKDSNPVILSEGLQVMCVLPIKHLDRVVGSLNISSHIPQEISPAIKLELETLAGMMGATIIRLETGEGTAEEREIFRVFMDRLPGLAWIRNNQGRVVYANRHAEKFFGMEPLLGKHLTEILPAEIASEVFAADRKTLMEGLQVDLLNLKDVDGKDHIFISNKFPVKRRNRPDLLGEIGIDISDRRQAEEKIQRQVEHLTALRTMDVTITTSLNLEFSLQVLVEQVVEQLGVDAAMVMLPAAETGSMEFAACRGTTRERGRSMCERMSGDIVPQIGRERRMVSNQETDGQTGLCKVDLTEEGYRTLFAAPLVAKGDLKGILVLLSREIIRPTGDWLDFLDAMATQAAIAIDNIRLYENLQRYNTSITEAYDETIEGWARALELRDQETEGHAKRVVELTERLARAMGVPETEMENYRRGALLHDIGKMGVPDAILSKPGPLTDAEWVVMHRHPEYARAMLSKIDFLAPALDIPYGHHEKWDGTGYPLGISGEDIPLAARVFALVDVWDALRYDRPYRRAWPEAQVVEYIRGQKGKHFDPKVLEIFLKILKKVRKI